MSSVSERFLRYVSFDTQSDENSPTCPSTAKQKVLGAAIVEEMKAMGPLLQTAVSAKGCQVRSPRQSRV